MIELCKQEDCKMAGILNLQFTPTAGDKRANLEKVRDMISGYHDKPLDLVFMP